MTGVVAASLLLAGPTVLSFFTGGYFDVPREWAGLLAWAGVVVAMVVVPGPLPRSRSAALAAGGLVLFAAWTLLSTLWAPIAGRAFVAGELVMLYLGVLFAATTLLRTRGVQRAVEPALAAGALIVVGYALSERMLPGLLHFQASVGAEGRLEQPLTYWNAMGELAAIGAVLATRIAGDATRDSRLRIAGIVATAPLGMGLYLSLSRGALFACAAGLVALIVAGPTRDQLRALLLAVATGVLAALVSAPFGGVSSLSGSLSARERDGAVVLALMLVIALLSGLVHRRLIRTGSDEALRLPRRAPLIALAVVCAGLALAIVSGAKESSTEPVGSGASRLTTLQSDRYDYWRVALHSFGQEPLRGVGAGGWSVAWLQRRPHNVGAQDAHSLPLQTMAELGLVGLVVLLVFFGGVALAVRRARAVAPGLAAGPIAGIVAYVAHAPLDWDWQMPALTLVPIVLAGLLLALGAHRSPGVATPAPGRGRTDGLNVRAGRGSIAARLGLGLAAVIMCAWFALGVRGFQDQNGVINLLSNPAPISTAQASAARASLNEAAQLNPDRGVDLLKAQLDGRRGDRAGALLIARRITRTEPQNIDAWLLITLVAKPGSAAYRRAQARVRVLAPPVPQ